MSRVIWNVLGLVFPILVVVGLCCSTPKARIDEPWHHTAVRLSDVAYAMHSYYAAYGSLPPAVVRDRHGKPLYSWRVAILHLLEEKDVEERFHLDEAWDSPHNSTLLDKTPHSYLPIGGGKDAPGLTRFQVFVGPGTAFEQVGPGLAFEPGGLTINDFPDGVENTLLVVEAGTPVPWSKPVDLTYDPAKPLPPLGGVYRGPVKTRWGEPTRKPGFVACFGDLKTRFIFSDTDQEVVRGLITRNGGEKVDLSKFD